MKAKLKLDMGAVKGFFIDHGEKIVVGLAVLILAWFTLSIFQRETLPANLQAKVIKDKSDQALHNVSEGSTAPPAGEGVLMASFTKRTELAPLPQEGYDLPQPVFRPNIFEAAQKRSDPKLFPVIELQATPGRGALVESATGAGGLPQQIVPQVNPLNPKAPVKEVPAKAAPPIRTRPPVTGPAAGPIGGIPGRGPGVILGPGAAGSGMAGMNGMPGAPSSGQAEAKYYMVITGAIPDELQRKEYASRFRNAQKMADASSGPDQGRMAVQDSDVPNYVWWKLERTDLTDGSVTMIDCGDVDQIKQDRQTLGSELVMSALKPGRGFAKLLQEIGDWSGVGADVVDPDFKGPLWMTWPLPPIVLHDWGREATHPRIPLAEEEAVAGPNGQPEDAKKPADDFDSAPANQPGRGRMPLAIPGRGRQIGPDMVNLPGAVVKQIPYLLFRFVDFQVEPGHSYQYRVKMVLRNPNFGKDPEVLDTPDLAKQPYRETDWSEKSKPAAPPSDTRLLATGIVKTPKNAEPRVKVSALVWDKIDAIDMLDPIELELGGIANFTKVAIKDVLDPVKRQTREISTDFVTDTALVDVRGTASLDKPLDGIAEPPEMLLLTLDTKGKPIKMTVVNQAADKPVAEEWEKYHKQAAADAATPLGAGPIGASPNNGGIFGQPAPKDVRPAPKKTGPAAK